nr:MAG: hypothetical protein [Penaeus semisulcatus pemonivirus]
MLTSKAILAIVFVLLAIGLVLILVLMSRQSVIKDWKTLRTIIKEREKRRSSSHFSDQPPSLPSRPKSHPGHVGGPDNITRKIYEERVVGESSSNIISHSTPPSDHITRVIREDPRDVEIFSENLVEDIVLDER